MNLITDIWWEKYVFIMRSAYVEKLKSEVNVQKNNM
jgi:hypothetical protein